MGVINRVHGGTANGRATSEPTAPTCLTDDLVLVLEITNLADGGAAVVVHLPEFAAGEAKKDGLPPWPSPGRTSCRPTELSALANRHLDVVDPGTERNGMQVPRCRADVRLVIGDDLSTHRETVGSQDVPLLAIRVVDERDAGAAVWIVLDRSDAPEYRPCHDGSR